MTPAYRLNGGAINILRRKPASAIVANQLVIRDPTGDGILEDPTTTAAADCLGISLAAGSPSTTQGTESGNVPFAYASDLVARCRISGSATAGDPLATTSPANVLTNTAADTNGLTVTAAEVGTIDMTDGTIWGLDGANAGQARIITGHTNNTSTAVTEPFLNDIAANDRFLRIPFSTKVQAVQLTSDFTEANGIIATGTGAVLTVVKVQLGDGNGNFDATNPEAFVFFVSGDHYYNPA